MTSQNPEDMRARFHELGKKSEEIRAASAPQRQQRDALRAQEGELRRQIRAIDVGIRTTEAGLFDIEQERAQLARALKGKTGAPLSDG